MYHNAIAIAPPHYNNKDCADCYPHKTGSPSFAAVLNSLIIRLFAFFSGNTAYAETAPLENYSMGGGAPEGGFMTFETTATVQTETVQSPQQTITTDVVYYYHNDHLGTPLFMTDESGNIVWRREQMPFGEDTLQRGTITENLRMPGQYWDWEKNSCYNGFRDSYYPNLGRYGQPDPIGIVIGCRKTKLNNHLYVYSSNNPEINIDRSGLLEASIDGCNFSRYKECDKLPWYQKKLCKKSIDWACSGPKAQVCCESEKQGCYACITCNNNENGVDARKAAYCEAYYIECISKLGKK